MSFVSVRPSALSLESKMEGETLIKFGDEPCLIAGDLIFLYECTTFGNSVIHEARTSEVDMSEIVAKGLQQGDR